MPNRLGNLTKNKLLWKYQNLVAAKQNLGLKIELKVGNIEQCKNYQN